MIKAIILDVDGVLVGTLEGNNFPEPSSKVLEKLSTLNKRGIFVALCTGKGSFAVEYLVKRAGLNNHHIVDGGGVIFNPISKKILKVNTIDKKSAHDVIASLVEKNINTEFYNVGSYFTQAGLEYEVSEQRYKILQRRPEQVENVALFSKEHDVVRIMSLARSQKEKELVQNTLELYKDKVKVSWTSNDAVPGIDFGLVTSKGISKGTATATLLETQGVDFADTLGVGDTMHDWQFIERCGYKATLANAKPELLELVRQHGGYVGPDVNEDGILDVIDHFLDSSHS